MEDTEADGSNMSVSAAEGTDLVAIRGGKDATDDASEGAMGRITGNLLRGVGVNAAAARAAADTSVAGSTSISDAASDAFVAANGGATAALEEEETPVLAGGVFFIALGTWGDVFPLFCAAVRTLENASVRTTGPASAPAIPSRVSNNGNMAAPHRLELFFATHACWAHALLLSARSGFALTPGFALPTTHREQRESPGSGSRAVGTDVIQRRAGGESRAKEQAEQHHVEGSREDTEDEEKREAGNCREEDRGEGAGELDMKYGEEKEGWRARKGSGCAQQRRDLMIGCHSSFSEAEQHDAGASPSSFRSSASSKRRGPASHSRSVYVGLLSPQQARARVEQLAHSLAATWHVGPTEETSDQPAAVTATAQAVAPSTEGARDAVGTATRPAAAIPFGTPHTPGDGFVRGDSLPFVARLASAADVPPPFPPSGRASPAGAGFLPLGARLLSPSVPAGSPLRAAARPSAAIPLNATPPLPAAAPLREASTTVPSDSLHTDDVLLYHSTVFPAASILHAAPLPPPPPLPPAAPLPSSPFDATSSTCASECCSLWFIPLPSSPLLYPPAAEPQHTTSLPCLTKEVELLLHLLLGGSQQRTTTSSRRCGETLHTATHTHERDRAHTAAGAALAPQRQSLSLATQTSVNVDYQEEENPKRHLRRSGSRSCSAKSSGSKFCSGALPSGSSRSSTSSSSNSYSRTPGSTGSSSTASAATTNEGSGDNARNVSRGSSRRAEKPAFMSGTTKTYILSSQNSCICSSDTNNASGCSNCLSSTAPSACSDSRSSGLNGRSISARGLPINRDSCIPCSSCHSPCGCSSSCSTVRCSSGIPRSSSIPSSAEKIRKNTGRTRGCSRVIRRNREILTSRMEDGGLLAEDGNSGANPETTEAEAEAPPLQRSPFVFVCNPFGAVWLHAAEAGGMARLLLVPTPGLAMREPPYGLIEALLARCPHLQQQVSPSALQQRGGACCPTQRATQQRQTSCHREEPHPWQQLCCSEAYGQRSYFPKQRQQPHTLKQEQQQHEHSGFYQQQQQQQNRSCSVEAQPFVECASTTPRQQPVYFHLEHQEQDPRQFQQRQRRTSHLLLQQLLVYTHHEAVTKATKRSSADCVLSSRRAVGRPVKYADSKANWASPTLPMLQGETQQRLFIHFAENSGYSGRVDAGTTAGAATFVKRNPVAAGAAGDASVAGAARLVAEDSRTGTAAASANDTARENGDPSDLKPEAAVAAAVARWAVETASRPVRLEDLRHLHWRLYLHDHDAFRESVLGLGPLLRDVPPAEDAAASGAVATESGAGETTSGEAAAGETAAGKAAASKAAEGKAALGKAAAAALPCLQFNRAVCRSSFDSSEGSRTTTCQWSSRGSRENSFAFSRGTTPCVLPRVSSAVSSGVSRTWLRSRISRTPSTRSRGSVRTFSSSSSGWFIINRAGGSESREWPLGNEGEAASRTNAKGSEAQSPPAAISSVDPNGEPRAIPVIHLFDADLFPEAAARLPASALVARPPSAPWAAFEALQKTATAAQADVILPTCASSCGGRGESRGEDEQRWKQEALSRSDGTASSATTAELQRACAATVLQQMQPRNQKQQERHMQKQHKDTEGRMLTTLPPYIPLSECRTQQSKRRGAEREEVAKKTRRRDEGNHRRFAQETERQHPSVDSVKEPPVAPRLRVSFFDDAGHLCFLSSPHCCCWRAAGAHPSSPGPAQQQCCSGNRRRWASTRYPFHKAARSDAEESQLQCGQLLSHAELLAVLREAGSAQGEDRLAGLSGPCAELLVMRSQSEKQESASAGTAAVDRAGRYCCEEVREAAGGGVHATSIGGALQAGGVRESPHTEGGAGRQASPNGGQQGDMREAVRREIFLRQCLNAQSGETTAPHAEDLQGSGSSEIGVRVGKTALARAVGGDKSHETVRKRGGAYAKFDEPEKVEGSALQTLNDRGTVVATGVTAERGEHSQSPAVSPSQASAAAGDVWVAAACGRCGLAATSDDARMVVTKQQHPAHGTSQVRREDVSGADALPALACRRGHTVSREDFVEPRLTQQRGNQALGMLRDRTPGWLLYVAFGSMHARELGLLPSVARLAQVFAAVGVALDKRVLLHVPFSSFDAPPLVQHPAAAEEFAAEAAGGAPPSLGVYTDMFFPRVVCGCGRQKASAAPFSFPWRVLVLHSVVDIPVLLNFCEIRGGERQKTANTKDREFSHDKSRCQSASFSADAPALDKTAASVDQAVNFSAASVVTAAVANDLSGKSPALVYVASSLRRGAQDAAGNVAENASEREAPGKDAAAECQSEAEKGTLVDRRGARVTALQGEVRGSSGGESVRNQQGPRSGEASKEETAEHRGGGLRAPRTFHRSTKSRGDTWKKVSTSQQTKKNSEKFSAGGFLEQRVFRKKEETEVLKRPREGQRLFCILTHASAGAASTFIPVATPAHRPPARDCCCKSAVCTEVSSYLKAALGGEDIRTRSLSFSARAASPGAAVALLPSSSAQHSLTAERQQAQAACEGAITEARCGHGAATASAANSNTTALSKDPTFRLRTESPFCIPTGQHLTEKRRACVTTREARREWPGVPWLTFPFFYDQPMIAARLEARGLAAVASESLLDCFEELAAAEKKVQELTRQRLPPETGVDADSERVLTRCASLRVSHSDSSDGHRTHASSKQAEWLRETHNAPQWVRSQRDQPGLTGMKEFEGARHVDFQPPRHGDGSRRQEQSTEREADAQGRKENNKEKAACRGGQTLGDKAACTREMWKDTQTYACRAGRTRSTAEHNCISSGASGTDHGTFAAARETNDCPPSCAPTKDTCCASLRGVGSRFPAEGAATVRRREGDGGPWNMLLSREERKLSLLQQKLVRLLLAEIRAAVWQKDNGRVGLETEQSPATVTTAPGGSPWPAAATRAGGACHTSSDDKGVNKTQTAERLSTQQRAQGSETSLGSAPVEASRWIGDNGKGVAVGKDPTACAAASLRVSSAEGTGGWIVQEDGARVAAWAILGLLQQQWRPR